MLPVDSGTKHNIITNEFAGRCSQVFVHQGGVEGREGGVSR